MDDVDRKILAYIQKSFPVSERPYLDIAADLGMEENDVKERIIRLYNEGYIKKIMPKFSQMFYNNYARALVAMKIDEKNIERAAGIINSYMNITHNYLRDHEYNVWFTVTAKSIEEIRNQVEEISHEVGAIDYIILRSVKTLKLNTEFEVD